MPKTQAHAFQATDTQRTNPSNSQQDSAYADAVDQYRSQRSAFWDSVAQQYAGSKWGRCYHGRLAEIYRFLVAPGLRVLELGCGRGGLLRKLEPCHGVGIDFSYETLHQAETRDNIQLVHADVHELDLGEAFDVIILSDLVNDLWDVQSIFQTVARHCTPESRIVINWYSRLWEVPLRVAEQLGIKRPSLPQNWLSVDDLTGLLRLSNLEVVREFSEILCPVPLFGLDKWLNRYLVKIWPFRWFALTNFIVARPTSTAEIVERPLVSVVVPARNEAGNIASIIARTPELGRGTELIFVEGHSGDDTYEVIGRAIADKPEAKYKLLRQTGEGKGDAVRLGFAQATGDLLIILDADLTVCPEDLTRFVDVLTSGKAEFVNGVRLVYPMEDQAMRFFNLLGNKLFCIIFSWILGQPVKDTLCGTKALSRHYYDRIAANRHYFGEFDPFGDFDLVFGAAKLNLKIFDLPVRYRQRTYGTTNIQRWRHGVLLLRMVVFALRRIKFV